VVEQARLGSDIGGAGLALNPAGLRLPSSRGRLNLPVRKTQRKVAGRAGIGGVDQRSPGPIRDPDEATR
jgi:hypothetical protein